MSQRPGSARLGTARLGTAYTSSTSLGNVSNFPTTSAGVTPQFIHQIQEGKYTTTIYSLIRDGKYKEVIKLITSYTENDQNNRAGLSLLAYSYYMLEDFDAAIQW